MLVLRENAFTSFPNVKEESSTVSSSGNHLRGDPIGMVSERHRRSRFSYNGGSHVTFSLSVVTLATLNKLEPLPSLLPSCLKALSLGCYQL